MGRDTLRRLEDEEVRVIQSIADGKLVLNLKGYLWLIRILIKQEKRLRKLEEKTQ